LVGDLPFGSYETGVRDAVVSATRMLKEGQMDAVKLEGELRGGVSTVMCDWNGWGSEHCVVIGNGGGVSTVCCDWNWWGSEHCVV